MAKRITGQIQSASSKLNQAIKLYNEVPPFGPDLPPHTVQRKDIMQLDAAFWHCLGPQKVDSAADVPYLIRRKLIDTLKIRNRAEEEKNATLVDIKTYIDNLSELGVKLMTKIQALPSYDDISKYDLGFKAYLVQHHHLILGRLENAKNLLEKVTGTANTDDLVCSIEEHLDNSVNNEIFSLEELQEDWQFHETC